MTTPPAPPTWTAYSTTTGLWVGTAAGHTDMVGPLPGPPDRDGVEWFDGTHAPHEYHLVEGALVARLPIVPLLSGAAVADGTTELEVFGLPLGATLLVQGPTAQDAVATTLTALPLILTFSSAGRWRIYVQHEPAHQDATIAIEVAAP